MTILCLILFPADLISCITFEHGVDHVQGLKGLWVKNNGVKIVQSGCVHKNCGYFSYAATLEIPFFTSNFAFRSFAVSFFFKSKTGFDGFLWNGCPVESGSSLSIATDYNVLMIRMNDKDFTLSTPALTVRTRRMIRRVLPTCVVYLPVSC